jgi:hypothetical protein
MVEENAYEVEVTGILNDLARNPRDQKARSDARAKLIDMMARYYEQGQQSGQHFGFLEGVRAGTKDAYLAGLRDAQDYEEDDTPVKRKGGRPKKGDQ